MASTDFDQLFEPEAIALIGASADPNKLSGRPYRYLQKFGYSGNIFLVNPSREEIDGQPCYDSITEIPVPVDVALVLVPARLSAEVIAECGQVDIPFAAVIASGFSEVGENGEKLESDLQRTAEQGDVRLIGPNSEGFVNVNHGVAATFSSICKRDDFISGGVGFVSQSGAFGGAIFQLVQNLGIGASKWITTGNEAGVDTLDLLWYLVEDPNTSVIATYVESLDEGRRLLHLGQRAAETNTPIVALRVGASKQGRTATESHTGSIASNEAVYASLFEQAGVSRVHTVDEFADTISAFSALDLDEYTHPSGGIGIVSISGGAAALIADTCARIGLPMADLAPQTVAEIREHIPPYGSPANPVDVTGSAVGQPELFERCVEAVGLDSSVDSVLFQFGNSGRETIETCEESIVALSRDHNLPVATVFTGAEPTPRTVDRLKKQGVLTFGDPSRALRVLQHLRDRTAFRYRAREQGPDKYDLPTKRRAFDPDAWTDVAGLLDEFDIPTPRAALVDEVNEAVELANSFDGSAVLKLDPIAVPHKSELGGVATGLETSTEVRAAFERLSNLDVDAGILCQETVEGVELITGVVEDEDFGPVLMFGPGGVFVELFDDAFSYRPLPVSEEDARELVDESSATRLLDGYRNYPPVNVETLSSLLGHISELYTRVDVAEIEFNPIIGTADGCLAVDALVE